MTFLTLPLLSPRRQTGTMSDRRTVERRQTERRYLSKFICPICTELTTSHVLEGRMDAKQGYYWRRRVCDSCGETETRNKVGQISRLEQELAQIQTAQEALKEDLKLWRGWAQFVYLGGGPVTLNDAGLREAVCRTHDAQLEKP